MNEIRSASEPRVKKALIYARFSTDLQNERSIEDQITLCRDYASRANIDVIDVYEDRARSGGSIMGRDGLLRLMDRAKDGSFDIVVVEALDRLSRDMEDLAGIHKRLSFLGIEIRAVHEGVVNTVLVGLRGLVGQLYREDNAHKVRRGLSGRVGQGLNAGGRAYGYAPIAGDKGKRTIVEAEAQIVRRIFEEYIGGRTPREIAHDLNNEGIAPPRGRSWNASTINGNMQRGTGLIQNELYAGRLVWNKVRMVKDPDTGKRLSRPNAKKDWQTADVPELRTRTVQRCAKSKTSAWPYAPEQATATTSHVVGYAPVWCVWCWNVHQREGQVGAHSYPLFRGHGKRHVPGRKDILSTHCGKRGSCLTGSRDAASKRDCRICADLSRRAKAPVSQSECETGASRNEARGTQSRDRSTSRRDSQGAR